MKAELARLARFCAVGALNTLLTLAGFVALTHVGVPTALASALGFGVGALNGYLLNRRWTFHGSTGGTATVLRYVAVQAIGAGLSAGGLALVTSDLALQRLAAEAMVLPIVTLTTYSLARSLVFRSSTAPVPR